MNKALLKAGYSSEEDYLKDLAKQAQGNNIGQPIKDEMDIEAYVVGFITDNKRVLLINKNRPKWQEGLFNGIGGKVEENESPLDAIIRETKEESGLDIQEWNFIEEVTFQNGVTLHVYSAHISSIEIEKYESLTDEKLTFHNKDELPNNLVKGVEYIIKNQVFKSTEIKEN